MRVAPWVVSVPLPTAKELGAVTFIAPATVMSPRPSSPPPFSVSVASVALPSSCSAEPAVLTVTAPSAALLPITRRRPPDTLTAPPPLTGPASVAEPLPDRLKLPPRVVAPNTDRLPPVTDSALPADTVSDAMAVLPLPWVTDHPLLMRAASSRPGSAPVLQLPGSVQSSPPLALVNTAVTPPTVPLPPPKISRAASPAARR